jgi:hypothetical protein
MVMKSKWMKWGHVARMGEKRNALVGKPERKRNHSEDLDID